VGKLFGFNLNDTSGVLLFIMSLIMVFTLFIGLMMQVNQYQYTGQVNIYYVSAFLLGLVFFGYILVKSLSQRNE
jgi:vacuolar-type H+-ATPase subunit I/STV1